MRNCIIVVLYVFIVTVIIIVSSLIFIGVYCENRDNDVPIIQYEKFIQFYNLNQERWKLKDIGSYQDNEVTLKYNRGNGYFNEHEKKFRFNIIDYYFKYRPFRRRAYKIKKRNVKQNTYIDSFTILTEEMNQEIEKLKAQAERELRKAKKLNEQVIKNLTK